MKKDGTLWSPARIEKSDVGMQLFLSTTAINQSNMNDERLWGNIEKKNGG